MEVSSTDWRPLDGMLLHLQANLMQTLNWVDSLNQRPEDNPLLKFDINMWEGSGFIAENSPQKTIEVLKNVSNLIVEFTQRQSESIQLLKMKHKSEELKHQMETRKLMDRLAEQEKVIQSEQIKQQQLSSEYELLEQKFTQERSSSTSKINLLQQKIIHLESSLSKSQEKTKQIENVEKNENQNIFNPNQLDESHTTSDISNSQLTNNTNIMNISNREKMLFEDEKSRLKTKITELERDLRVATETMRSEHEKLEKSENDLKKAQSDLSRLKSHLIDIQDESDELNMSLRNEIEQLKKEKAAIESSNFSSQSSSFSDQSSQIQQYQQSIESYLSRIEELDLENEQYELEKIKFEETISNLESSLIQLQSEQQTEIELHTITLKNQLESEKVQKLELEELLKQERIENEQKSKLLFHLESVQKDMESYLLLKNNLENQNKALRLALDDAAQRLSAMAQNNDSLIAKPIIHKIFTTYLNPKTSSSSKTELLHLVANLLDFTDEERKPLGIPLKHEIQTQTKPGIVSILSSATGSVVSGSINKGKKLFSFWGSSDAQQNQQNQQNQSQKPSIADIWLKILMEGSEPNEKNENDNANKNNNNSIEKTENQSIQSISPTINNIPNDLPPQAFQPPSTLNVNQFSTQMRTPAGIRTLPNQMQPTTPIQQHQHHVAYSSSQPTFIEAPSSSNQQLLPGQPSTPYHKP